MSTITTQAGRAVRARVPAWFRKDATRPVAGTTDRTDRSDKADTNPGPRAARLTPRGMWVLAAVVLVAALALAATLGREAWTAHRTEQARAEAVAAARQLAVNFVTVDHRTVDRDISRVRAGATGTFLESYTSSVEELKKVLVQNKTVSRAERTEAALVSGDLDSAVVLVGVVAPTQNTSVPDGEKKTYRMRLQLRKASDAWKVENLEFVG